MINPILHVEAIEKQFHTVKAVDKLSFQIEKGEIFALLGPNGAGKTTTVRILLGIIKPDSGSVFYSLRNDVCSAPSPADLGYLPEDRGLYRDIPIIKTLAYMGILRGLDRQTAETAARRWLERVNLWDRANEKLDALSKGNQQKVQFISAILHQPVFAILDEPFSGFDPVNQEFFLEVIRDLRDSGTTIVLCAHQMNLVERIADRVLLINNGKEVLKGTMPEIKLNARASMRVVFSVNGEPDISLLTRHQSVESAEYLSTGRIALLLKKDEPLSEFLAAAARTMTITSIHSEQISLHDIFIQTVGLSNDLAPKEKTDE
jgi:ABC-2 type transport system ATP-binding protein